MYGLVLLLLTLNIFLGMAIIETEKLNSFTVLGLVIDSVVQIVLLIFFFGISVAFLKGIKDVSSSNVVLNALISILAFIH